MTTALESKANLDTNPILINRASLVYTINAFSKRGLCRAMDYCTSICLKITQLNSFVNEHFNVMNYFNSRT